MSEHRTGRDLGFPEGHPFADAEVISEYSIDQAVEDGTFIALSDKLRITRTLATQLVEEPEDAALLREAISGIVSEYVTGAYCVPHRASEEPGNCDADLACYLIDRRTGRLAGDAPTQRHEIRVWACADGAGGITIMLPEDY